MPRGKKGTGVPKKSKVKEVTGDTLMQIAIGKDLENIHANYGVEAKLERMDKEWDIGVGKYRILSYYVFTNEEGTILRRCIARDVDTLQVVASTTIHPDSDNQ